MKVRRSSHKLGLALSMLVAGMFWALPGQAQTIAGVLVDDATMHPIGGAAVQLQDAEGNTVGAVMTAGDGRFRLQAPRPGRYKIIASRIGYETGESDLIDLEEDMLNANLLLPSRPVMLDEIGIEVEAQRWRAEQPPSIWPFFERMERGRLFGMGRFMDREDLDVQGGRIGDLWEVQLMYQGYRSGTIGAISLGQPCTDPAFYLDGMRISATRQSIDDYIAVDELEGVEIYRRASEVPAVFGGSDAQCGVVALWTRRVP
jgi:hypothetical protein